ncbi:MAG TPA: rhodanese-like domain-containing protein [Pyrinomonadaceae bacterium]
MRLFISKAAVLGLCACALLAACSPQDGSAPAAARSNNSAPAANANTTANTTAQASKQTPAQQAGETRRISIEETQAAIAGGSALVVDVRDENTYKTSHIKGAKSIPLQQFEQRAGELPKDKLIITYCA